MPLYKKSNIEELRRHEAISDLVARAIDNPLVSSESMVLLFESMASQISTYERTGYNIINTALQKQIDENGTFKVFLEGYIDEAQTITVLQAIQASLA